LKGFTKSSPLFHSAQFTSKGSGSPPGLSPKFFDRQTPPYYHNGTIHKLIAIEHTVDGGSVGSLTLVEKEKRVIDINTTSGPNGRTGTLGMIIKKRTADETLPTIGIHGVTSLGTMKASSLVLRNIAPIQTATHIGGIHLNTRRGIFAKLTEPCFQMPPLSINTPLLILVNYATFQFRHSIGELQSNIIVSNNTTFQKTFIKAIGVFLPHTPYSCRLSLTVTCTIVALHIFTLPSTSAIAQETIQCNISYKTVYADFRLYSRLFHHISL
jgi:hypothetical protein